MLDFFTFKENLLLVDYNGLFISLKEHFLLLLLGFIMGFLISKTKSIIKFINFVKEAILNGNIENIVLSFSVILVVLSIILECSGITNGLPNIVLNIFGTLIVSWLVTKKNSEKELKKTQEDTAKKSRRYLNSIMKSTKNAIVVIDEAMCNDEVKKQGNYFIEILKNAKNQVVNIQTGIEAAIVDWEDLMSKEDVNMANSSPTITQDTLNELNMTIPNSAAIESFQNDNRINQDEA